MNRYKCQSGFLMIEVLVAMIVFAISLIGIAGMLVISHKSSSSSYIKQQAVQSANDILDRINANRTEVTNANYDTNNLSSGTPVYPSAPTTDCGTSSCSSTQIATYDKWYWLAKDLTQLPNGSGSIKTSVSGNQTTIVVTVQWDDSPAQKKLGASTITQGATANLSQFIVQTEL